jgi:hypothetical protein
MRLRQNRRQVGIGTGQPQAHPVLAVSAAILELLGDIGDLRAHRRVLVAQQRMDHVGRGEFTAVVEAHASPQVDEPVAAVRARDCLRQSGPGFEALVLDRGKTAVDHEMARVVGRARTLGRIERVAGRGKLGGHPDRTAYGGRAPLPGAASAQRQRAGAGDTADEMAT